MASGVGFRLGFYTTKPQRKQISSKSNVFSLELNMTFSEHWHMLLPIFSVYFFHSLFSCSVFSLQHLTAVRRSRHSVTRSSKTPDFLAIACFVFIGETHLRVPAELNITSTFPRQNLCYCRGDQLQPRREITPCPGSTHLPYLFMRRRDLHWGERPRRHRGAERYF